MGYTEHLFFGQFFGKSQKISQFVEGTGSTLSGLYGKASLSGDTFEAQSSLSQCDLPKKNQMISSEYQDRKQIIFKISQWSESLISGEFLVSNKYAISSFSSENSHVKLLKM